MKKFLAALLIFIGVCFLAYNAYLLIAADSDISNIIASSAIAAIFITLGAVWLNKRLKKERENGEGKRRRRSPVKYIVLGIAGFSLLVGAFFGLDWYTNTNYAYERNVEKMMQGDATYREKAEETAGYRDTDRYIELYDCLRELDADKLYGLLDKWKGFPHENIARYAFSVYDTEYDIARCIALGEFYREYNARVSDERKITGNERELAFRTDSIDGLISRLGKAADGRVIMLTSEKDILFGNTTYKVDTESTLALSETLCPESADLVSYVILTEYEREQVGFYENGGGNAYQYVARVRVFETATGEQIWSGGSSRGSEPPKAIPKGQRSASGDMPDMSESRSLALDYIAGLSV